MDINEFVEQLKRKSAELNEFRHRKMPIMVGRMAKDHFQDNFRQGGFVNGGLHPWQEAERRKKGGKSAASKKGTLLSSRNHLFNSIKYIPGDACVRVTNNVEYAALHNNGGTISPTVTPKMRGFAWAQYFEAAGITKGMKPEKRKAIEESLPEDTLKWKRLALTKKKKLSVRMPQRQFMGDSQELDEKVKGLIDQKVTEILNK